MCSGLVATHYEHGAPPGQNFHAGSQDVSCHVTTLGVTIKKKDQSEDNVCTHCNKGCKSRNLLFRHVLACSHSHCCDYCNRSFVRKDHLVEHMLVHKDERPFECQLCPMTFKRHGNFTRHVRLHKGGKPFQCDLCPKAFSQKHNLKRHKEGMHKENTATRTDGAL
ncbi:zinc finger and BTB domain-containing protein 41-like isoform X1 [Amblyomma americanum]